MSSKKRDDWKAFPALDGVDSKKLIVGAVGATAMAAVAYTLYKLVPKSSENTPKPLLFALML